MLFDWIIIIELSLVWVDNSISEKKITHTKILFVLNWAKCDCEYYFLIGFEQNEILFGHKATG